MGKMEKSKANVTPEMLDTLAILDEHTQNLIEAIQQEKEKLRTQALEESRKIISEAENEARQIIMKAIRDAENQSTGVLTRSTELVDLMIDEAEKSKSDVAELKQNTKKEIEASKVKLRREADIINEIISETEKTIHNAIDGLQYQFEGWVKTATEARKELEQAAKAMENITHIENKHLGESTRSLKETTSDIEGITELTEAKVHDQSSNKDDDKHFVGTLYLEVLSERSSEYKKLQGYLAKIPNIEVLSVDDAEDNVKKINIFLSKPCPLIKILNEMTFVTKAVADKGNIRVDLRTADLWRE